MQTESAAVLLRIFITESDKYKSKNLCHYLVKYLRTNHFAGVTVVKGIAGFGRSSKIHESHLFTLSSDLPIVIEIVDNEEKIELLKKALDESLIIGSALITEEKVKIYQYGSN